MPKLYYDSDASLSQLANRKFAVIGFGSQGHAHALNLRDSGLDVRVGLPETSASRAKAEAAGLRVMSIADAAREGDVIMILVPDHVQRSGYCSLARVGHCALVAPVWARAGSARDLQLHDLPATLDHYAPQLRAPREQLFEIDD